MIAIVAGILVGALIILIARVLSPYFSLQLIAATCLVGIGFIYIGFALKDNPIGIVIMEITAALCFYFLAIIGYSKRPTLLALGIMLHGVWDIIHHHAFVLPTAMPDYWPLFCCTIDIIDGIYFLIVFRLQNKHAF